MGMYLTAICRNHYPVKDLAAAAELLRAQLRALNLAKLYYPTWIPSHGEEWTFQLITDDAVPELCFTGPYELVPTVLHDCVLIDIGYRYSVLYRTDELTWFARLRGELFRLVRLFGADEVIFLADSGHYLARYYYEPYDGTSYDEVKSLLKNDFGDPITSYDNLDYNKLDYSASREYFLDNFSDLS